MAHWSASITRSMWRYASRPDGRQAQPRRSSTVRAPRARKKKGASLDPQGFDAGKKIRGRKRHRLVDTLGLLLSVAVHAANIQDRDGVALVLDRRTRRCSRSLSASMATVTIKGLATPKMIVFSSSSVMYALALPRE